jgi:hypothetical protein
MTIADGTVLFIACMASFCVGYLIGVFRVSRYVAKQLKQVSTDLQLHRRQLEQFYSKLGENEPPLEKP